MVGHSLISVVKSGILLTLFLLCAGKRTWDHEILSVTTSSTDESKLNVTARAERVDRRGQLITAVVDWKFDSDENTMVEMLMLTCQSGREEDYFELPYKVPRMSIYDGFKKYYVDILYENYRSCSNLPNITTLVGPWPQNTYIFDRCTTTGDGFPDILPAGYYKLIFRVSGPVEMEVTLIFKLTSKLM